MITFLAGNPVLRFAKKRRLKAINLHLGCGGHHLKDYINIDYFKSDKKDSSRTGFCPDLRMDIRKMSMPDQSVDEILTIHTLEHFNRWLTVSLIRKWFGWLKPGGKLIVEQPDLDQCIHFYINHLGEDLDTPLGKLNRGYIQFYGNQWDELDHETHRYVWTAGEFKQVLAAAGFSKISISHAARYHIPQRDMYVEAIK
ncbi:MAG: hypothetical protein A2293_14375 [Elusimicrobia bacterium RIFOXYB2_FULL_49_7]|nr:MAG: hypothetical protein A2293_14375 [Elusimicrobia bacterium RIFOXYB2_FULL_49_7]